METKLAASQISQFYLFFQEVSQKNESSLGDSPVLKVAWNFPRFFLIKLKVVNCKGQFQQH